MVAGWGFCWRLLRGIVWIFLIMLGSVTLLLASYEPRVHWETTRFLGLFVSGSNMKDNLNM